MQPKREQDESLGTHQEDQEELIVSQRGSRDDLPQEVSSFPSPSLIMKRQTCYSSSQEKEGHSLLAINKAVTAAAPAEGDNNN